MPRKKRPRKIIEKTCVVCTGNFTCSRDDKETCGPTCRKRLSRANGEMYHAQVASRVFGGQAPGRPGRRPG